MTTETFTPGPWRAEAMPVPFGHDDFSPLWEVIHGKKGLGVSIVTLYGDAKSADETSANAKLIAAAPDLYAALKALVSAHARDINGEDEMTAAWAALAKAKGDV